MIEKLLVVLERVRRGFRDDLGAVPDRLISKRLDELSIHYKVKNGVLTLSGNVPNQAQRQEAELLASKVPNVQQVMNQLSGPSKDVRKSIKNVTKIRAPYRALGQAA